MSQRIIRRVKNPDPESDKQKKLNRRSKLFYVTCDYIEVNGKAENESESGDSTSTLSTPTNETVENAETGKSVDGGSKKSGLIINVHSEPVNLFIDGNSDAAAARERKKRNRKSKLFYVSCDEINVNSILDDGQVYRNFGIA